MNTSLINNNDVNKTAKYKFEQNLIILSNSTTFEEALQEWEQIDGIKVCLNPDDNVEHDKKYELCICQRRVGNIYFFRNKITLTTMCVGTGCVNKLKKYYEQNNIPQLNSKILRNIYTTHLKRGEYEIIDNIVHYSNNIRNLIIDYLNNKIKKYTKISDINELITLLDDLTNIKEYDLCDEIKIIEHKINDMQELIAAANNRQIKTYSENELSINLNKFKGVPDEQIDRLFINKLQNIINTNIRYIKQTHILYNCEIDPNTILCFRCNLHSINTPKIYNCIECETIYNYWVNILRQMLIINNI